MRSGANPSSGATAGASTGAAALANATSTCTSSMADSACQGWVEEVTAAMMPVPARAAEAV
jgi:hypothetical protein